MTRAVALIGAGGVGRKRAAAVAAHPDTELVAVCDVDLGTAEELAAEHGARAFRHREPALVAADLAVVSTTHDALAPVTVAALEAGCHVLCEKPLGRTRGEVAAATAAAATAGRVLRAGYNHRFHPGIRALHEAVVQGRLGPLLYLRGRYGHGGRPGYEREWRADPVVSGGGELLDQGAHLVDLALWLLGDCVSAVAHTQRAFWEMPVEDNAFALLRTAADQVASLHVSWTQWRNLFSLEVCGRDGYGRVEGLGGSYGPERMILGRRRSEGGVPEESTTLFDGPDRSWGREWEAFVGAVAGLDTPGADGVQALRTMEWIQRLYASAAALGSAISIVDNPW